MSLFALGDPHLAIGLDKPMDIFPGWEHHKERIEENWERLITPGDVVVLPGDISWAMSLEDAKADFAFLDRLPGTKLISKGNHDYWWTTVTKMNAFFAENGFTTLHILHNNAYVVGNYAVCATRGWFFDDDTPHSEKVLNREVGRLQTAIAAAKETGKEPLVFLHYPPVTQREECAPIMDVLRESGVRRVYYAHLHGNVIPHAFQGERDGMIFRLVSADALHFCPLLLESDG